MRMVHKSFTKFVTKLNISYIDTIIHNILISQFLPFFLIQAAFSSSTSNHNQANFSTPPASGISKRILNSRSAHASSTRGWSPRSSLVSAIVRQRMMDLRSCHSCVIDQRANARARVSIRSAGTRCTTRH